MTRILSLIIALFVPYQAYCQEEQLIFGQSVTHPFQWMEDITSDKVKQWLESQKSQQAEYFKKSDFKKLNSVLYVPRREHQLETNRYRFELITLAATPPKLVVKEFIDGENVVRTLIRCKDFKLNENDFPSIEYYRVTDSEYFLIAAISHSGSDWLELLVYDLEKRVLLETLKGIVDPRIVFHYNGFYYERYDEPTDIKSTRTHQRITFHEIGTPQENDRDIFVNADPTSIRYFQFQRIPDSKFIYVFHPTMINGSWKEAITKIELGKFITRQPFFIYSSPHRITFDLIMQEEDTVMMRTDLRNSNFEVIKIRFFAKMST